MRLRPPEKFVRLCRDNGQGTAEVGARQIYILPTRYGFSFGVLLLLMLLGSINYTNNLGFLLTFLLVGLGLMATLHTWRNLVGLQLRPGRNPAVFKGQEAVFNMQLINQRQSERPNIRLAIAREQATVATDLAPTNQDSLQLHITAQRRGRLAMPRLSVSTRYPLGLLHAWCYVEMPAECLVYPAPGPRLPLNQTPSYSKSQTGDKGVGVDDFVGLRPYREGDSPKQISWKALAREQGLQSKQFGGDRAERRWLDWESLAGLDTEARLSALCRGVLEASEQQLEYGLKLPDQVIRPGRGERQRQKCLTALALFGEPL